MGVIRYKVNKKMKWYNAEKKKPYGGEYVLIWPSAPWIIAYWDHKKKAWYYTHGYKQYYHESLCPTSIIKKWAYINYPIDSLEHITCSRKWNPWRLKLESIWRKIKLIKKQEHNIKKDK